MWAPQSGALDRLASCQRSPSSLEQNPPGCLGPQHLPRALPRLVPGTPGAVLLPGLPMGSINGPGGGYPDLPSLYTGDQMPCLSLRTEAKAQVWAGGKEEA